MVAAVLFAVSSAGAQEWDLAALRAFSGLTPAQWDALRQGVPQSRVLDVHGQSEGAVVGMARVRANTACFLTQFQDIENFKMNPAVLKIRKFATPVEPRDLTDFSLTAEDLAGLPQCRAGNCNVKLSSEAIQRMAHDVEWSQPDHDAQAQTVFREELLKYLQTYPRQGNQALIVYRDKSTPVSLAREFRGVLDASGLNRLVPRFHDYLAAYPDVSLPGLTGFLYWSTESFGLKPVDSVTQVFVYTQPGRVVIASKQLYASHYFDASLGLTAALDDSTDPSHTGMYLVYVNRSRIDLLSGFLGPLRRAIMRGRLRDGLRKNMMQVVARLESSCG